MLILKLRLHNGYRDDGSNKCRTRMANNNSQQPLISIDGRSLLQWIVTYAVILEVLDFLVGTYGGSTQIVKTATTIGITSFIVLLTVHWLAGREEQKISNAATVRALFASLFIVLTSTIRTALPDSEWLLALATAADFAQKYFT